MGVKVGRSGQQDADAVRIAIVPVGERLDPAVTPDSHLNASAPDAAGQCVFCPDFLHAGPH